MRRKIAIIILLSITCFFNESENCLASMEIIKTDFSAAHNIRIATNSYIVTTTIAGSNASQTELKTSTSSLISGYLSQIPSMFLNFRIQNITGGPLSLGNKILGVGADSQPSILFSNELSSATISTTTIKVTETFDHLGNLTNNELDISTEYNPETKTIKINPISVWPKGSLFTINFSSTVKDSNLLPLTGGPTIYFTTLMEATTDNTIVLIGNPNTKINIAANACDEDFFVNLSTNISQNGIEDANRKLTGILGSDKTPLKILSADFYNSSATLLTSNLKAPAKISFSYENLDKDGNGFIDNSFEKLKTKNLSIWRLNEEKNLWVRQSGYYVDTASKKVSLNTNHFSTYALVPQADMEVSNIYAYPVPFRPNSGNPQRHGSWTDGITFTNLPSEGEIKIYTISMRLVKTLKIIPNEIKWDIKNNSGEIAASGLYIWEAISGNNRKTGKLVIIK